MSGFVDISDETWARINRVLEIVEGNNDTPGKKFRNYLPKNTSKANGKWLQACKAEGESEYQISFEDWTAGTSGPTVWNMWGGGFYDDAGTIFSADYWHEGEEPTYYEVRNVTGQYITEGQVCWCAPTTVGDTGPGGGTHWLCKEYAPPIMICTLDEVLESGGEAEATIINGTGFIASLGNMFPGGTMTVKDVMEAGDIQSGATVIAQLTSLPGNGFCYVVSACWPCPGV